MILKLNICLTTFSVLILLSFSTQAFAANQAKTKTAVASSTVSSQKNLKNSTSEVVEGSANVPAGLADVEVNGSGYPTDDEDGDDVHGSGKPPSPAVVPTTTKADVKHTSPSNVVVTAKPTTIPTTTASFKPPVQPKPKPAANDKEIKVEDDDDDDEDEDEDDDEDDEDFADENIHNDDDFFTTTTTTHRPVAVVTTTTPRSHVAQSTNPPRQPPPIVTSTISSGPFSPFHETMTNGFYAAIAGGVLVAVITAILLVLFVVFRIRKKDEGSYALDEPKQARPYNSYAYTKAATKEFYA
ncbi:CBN-SDN-1 protein [Caenorhabditis brenneri]|uniref:Syndecan n=1 Tax=Caenorhabditis brenneri TaxID=135651 RepID=G0MI84_CAEBE|nr:CBN-SDN-1 protein [Caenorhabditis brenneri]